MISSIYFRNVLTMAYMDNWSSFSYLLLPWPLKPHVDLYCQQLCFHCIYHPEKHIKWYYMIWLCFGRFWPLSDLYHVTLTSKKLKIIIFQLGTPDYLSLDTKTTKLTRIQPYLYCQWPFWIYANSKGLTHPKRCVLYQDLISTYQRSFVPILVISCRNEHSNR